MLFTSFSNLIAGVKPVVEWPVRAVVDFAIPDVCYLCARPAKRPAGPAVQLPAAAEHLAGEAVVSILRLISVANHPFCRRCLSKLQPLGRSGPLGACGISDGVGWVETVTGERFSRAPVAARQAPANRPASPLVVYSPFRMSDASLEIIHLIKFSRRRSLAPLAAGAMAHALRTQSDIVPGVVLVPVPMHRTAVRRRGFNQAELLAAHIARSMHGGTVYKALRKTIRTRRQSVTDHQSRADNVRGVFRWEGDPLDGKTVVLVDDLVTTGATVASCASELLAAGAEQVTAACLARAL
jgi:ComF family protein